MRTYLAIAEGALIRGLDLNLNAPAARSVLYRRISQRQRALFARAAQLNPEYFGVEAIGTLNSGGISLDAMVTSNVLEAEAVAKVLIENKGTSAYTAGDQVTVVPDSDDATAYFAPRCTIKNRVLNQIGTDLASVTSIRVKYSYKPAASADAEPGTSTVALEDPFDELLVLDTYKWLLKKTIELDAAVREATLAVVKEEEAELLGQFDEHVLNYVVGRQSRMAHQQGRVRG